ncbi:MAG: VWA-like domain-containing protein [Synergistaceae bacterium]|jgi:predicted metal-dependent peptidase|nr:VWA-like domain-containing protein [Synergistaceae bacterium]
MAKRKGWDICKKDIWLERFQAGEDLVRENPIFKSLLLHVHVNTQDARILVTKDFARCYDNTVICVNRSKSLYPKEWAYVLAHCLLHYALWHFGEEEGVIRADPVKWNVACDMYITRFLKDVKLFTPPDSMNTELPYPPLSEDELYRKLMPLELDEIHRGFSVGAGYTDMETAKDFDPFSRMKNPKREFAEIFERALADAVRGAIGVAAGYLEDINDHSSKKVTPAEGARRWFINCYPLLGALAASFKIVEDASVCWRENISVAAVSESLSTIYFNPSRGLTEEEYRFIIAHELLHVGLRHQSRCQGRDPFLWNVACDYVINGWLVEMEVGSLPRIETLFDTDFKDMSAEQVYDVIVRDIRRFKKQATLRGVCLSDMLGEGEVRFHGAPVGLDEFYRRAISEGLEYHKSARGLIPLGLEEEIRALYRDPIPWDVELARWFDRFFAPLEKKRTYSRLSRRQSSTPDIVRPRTVQDPKALDGRTFGVVIDTSGSMDHHMLAVALGSAASYADSRDVPYVRVVFCDAAAYDAGYMPPDAIMENIRVRGRGGTILQPGIDFLERAEDFPKKGPILIITDSYCDNFVVRREHAIMIPKGRRLPFRPRGEVFAFE